jgi:murein L,D-transpeptidase YafK
MKTALLPLPLFLLGLAPCGGQARSICRAGETAVVVNTEDHRLHLCQAGRPIAGYRVALGAGGTGKQREGDGKTPLGAYQLAPPRASASYGTFVHVGYPTPAQQRAGLTGSAVGIHGPPRGWSGGSALATAVDWTAGCIAVGSDAEIEAISAWLRRLQVRSVRIE